MDVAPHGLCYRLFVYTFFFLILAVCLRLGTGCLAGDTSTTPLTLATTMHTAPAMSLPPARTTTTASSSTTNATTVTTKETGMSRLELGFIVGAGTLVLLAAIALGLNTASESPIMPQMVCCLCCLGCTGGFGMVLINTFTTEQVAYDVGVVMAAAAAVLFVAVAMSYGCCTYCGDTGATYEMAMFCCLGFTGFTGYAVFWALNPNFELDYFDEAFGPDNANISYSNGSCFFKSGANASNTTDCCPAYLAAAGLGSTGHYGNGYGSNVSIDTDHVMNKFLRDDTVCGAAFVDCVGVPELVSVPLGPLVSLGASVITYYLTPKVNRTPSNGPGLLFNRSVDCAWVDFTLAPMLMGGLYSRPLPFAATCATTRSPSLSPLPSVSDAPATHASPHWVHMIICTVP